MYWITGILGILLIIAPFALRYSSDIPALWSNLVLGIAVLIVSALYFAFSHFDRNAVAVPNNSVITDRMS